MCFVIISNEKRYCGKVTGRSEGKGVRCFRLPFGPQNVNEQAICSTKSEDSSLVLNKTT